MVGWAHLVNVVFLLSLTGKILKELLGGGYVGKEHMSVMERGRERRRL